MSRESEYIRNLQSEIAKRDSQIRDMQMAEIERQNEEAATLRKVTEERVARERTEATEAEKIKVCKSEWTSFLITHESGGLPPESVFDPVNLNARVEEAMKSRGLLPPGLEEVDLRHMWMTDTTNIPSPATGLSPMDRMAKVLAGMKSVKPAGG